MTEWIGNDLVSPLSLKQEVLVTVIYIELLRLQIFQLEKVKEVPPYTMHKFGSLILRIVDIQA